MQCTRRPYARTHWRTPIRPRAVDRIPVDFQRTFWVKTVIVRDALKCIIQNSEGE